MNPPDTNLPTPENNLPAPENVISLSPAKKESIRPPDPKLDPEPEAPELMLAPYPDGVLFRCSPKPGARFGEMLIHDGAGTIVAITNNKQMAQLICAAVHIYTQAARQNAAEQVAAAAKVEETLNAPVAPEGAK